MQLAHTLARGVEFRYDGNLAQGTTIEFGQGRTCNVSREEYNLLRTAFVKGAVVSVGASHTNPPADSLGAWLRDNIHEQRGIASYVAAILVAEGCAAKLNSTTIRFN